MKHKKKFYPLLENLKSNNLFKYFQKLPLICNKMYPFFPEKKNPKVKDNVELSMLENINLNNKISKQLIKILI